MGRGHGRTRGREDDVDERWGRWEGRKRGREGMEGGVYVSTSSSQLETWSWRWTQTAWREWSGSTQHLDLAGPANQHNTQSLFLLLTVCYFICPKHPHLKNTNRWLFNIEIAFCFKFPTTQYWFNGVIYTFQGQLQFPHTSLLCESLVFDGPQMVREHPTPRG